MTAKDISALKALWQEAFNEPDDFTNLFFSVGFSPDRCHCLRENDLPVSALYWFDCHLQDRKLAYVYAVATLKSHQGKGLARRLMAETHEILQNRGYDGVILVPAGEKLFAFYQNLGYETATTVSKIPCVAADTPVALRRITGAEYARLCPKFMPRGGVVQGEAAFAFLEGYCEFYAGENFLLTCEKLPEGLRVQEFLGDIQAAPGILRALDCEKGAFRTPGTDRPFAMFLPLQADCPVPGWFALALD